MGVTILSAGVDTMYLSYRGFVDSTVLAALDQLKAEAQGSSGPVRIALEGGPLAMVLPRGWGRYRVWLQLPDFDLFIGSGERLPSVYVQLRSSFIHTVGPTEACRQATALVASGLHGGESREEVSRIDIYADFQGWVPEAQDLDRFVTRASSGVLHHDAALSHFRGRRLTGLKFGRGAVVARLYDKTAEILQSGKTWLWDIWGQAADRDKPVWRLELQYRREALRDFNVSGSDQVLAIRQDLWKHGLRWLSLRDVAPNRQRDHWPVAAEWADLAGISVGAPVAGVIRKRFVEQRTRSLVQGAIGYVTSIAAQERIHDLRRATDVVARMIDDYLRIRGRTFAGEVRRKTVDDEWRAPIVSAVDEP